MVPVPFIIGGEGKPGPEVGDKLDFKFVLRPAINEKWKQSTPVPAEHMGRPLQDTEALTVGELALQFYQSLVDEAEHFTT